MDMHSMTLAFGFMVGLVYAYVGLVVVVVAEERLPAISHWVDDSMLRGIGVLILWFVVLPWAAISYVARRRAR